MNYQIFIKKATIPFFVFITGACVLIIEILAIRILAPYFGNTTFSVSSVISVVLGALSLGYYIGGKLADRHPQEKLFYGIIMASGCCVIFLHVVGAIFLPSFGHQFSIAEGPIVSSLVLFFLQSFLLGMLSPFAIKLQTMRLEKMGIGSVSGGIFFWSTLGSIFGSLAAGFFLIPHFGIDKIILSVGFLLIVLGFCAMVKVPAWLKLFLIAILVTPALFSINSFVAVMNKFYASAGFEVYDGEYQKIITYEGEYYGRPARFLVQDRNSSAAAYINSDELVYGYTKYYALYKIFNPETKEALVIGGGAYSVPKALLRDSPNIVVDVAEIESSLFDLSKTYFNVPNDSRLHNFVEDGRRLLVDSNKKYDMIFSDAYSSIYSTPSHLTTQEFFKIAKDKLNNHGVFIANVVGSLSSDAPSIALSEIKTFKSVFDNSYFFAVSSPDSQALQNMIFVGYNGASKIDINSPIVRGNKNPVIANLAAKRIDLSKIDFSSQLVLTDNFSPVEYLTAKELTKSKY